MLKPSWLYGIQLWGCTSQRYIKIIQTFQNKVLRNIVDAPRYARNSDIHRDLNIPYVADEIKRSAQKHQQRVRDHVNPEVTQLLVKDGSTRRLKRKRPSDLVQ
jgi:hypothetical protein